MPAEWRIPLEDVAFLRQIGAGSNGTCYEARWRRLVHCVRQGVGRAGEPRGVGERRCPTCQNCATPNVIQLLGVIATRPTYCLVLEYCPGGDRAREPAGPTNAPPPPPRPASPVCACVCVRVLSASASCYEFLRGATGTPRRSRRRPDHAEATPPPPPPPAARYSLGCPPAGRHRPGSSCACRVASPPVWPTSTREVFSTRDLKSSNVLLDGAGVAKLIDFGTATRGGGTNSPSQGALTAEAGTFRWMAPEVINHEVYSRPADGSSPSPWCARCSGPWFYNPRPHACAPVSTPTSTCMRPCVYTHAIPPRAASTCMPSRAAASTCMPPRACTHTLRWSMN